MKYIFNLVWCLQTTNKVILVRRLGCFEYVPLADLFNYNISQNSTTSVDYCFQKFKQYTFLQIDPWLISRVEYTLKHFRMLSLKTQHKMRVTKT